jgi:hypothetical protein
MTTPAATGPTTEIEFREPSSAFDVGAHEPGSSAAIRAWGRREVDVVSLRVPVVAIRQLYSVVPAGDTHACSLMTILVPPEDHEAHMRAEHALALPLPYVEAPIPLHCRFGVPPIPLT